MLRTKSLLAAATLACGFGVALPVSAASVTTFELLNYFNSVTLGDTQTGHDIEGRTYVGGNLNLPSSASLNIKASPSASPYDALVVKGNIVAQNGFNLNNGGNFVAGGSYTGGSLGLNGGAGFVGGANNSSNSGISANQNGPAFDARFPDNVETTVKATSSYLSGLAATGSTSYDPGGQKLVFNATGSASEPTIYNIDWSLFATRPELAFSLNGATNAIVNVFGNGFSNAGFNITNNFFGSEAISKSVLWNFVDATVVNFERQFFGAVLAPLAHVTNSTPIEGSVIAGSARYNGEVHVYGFNGAIPEPSVAPAPPAVPVPAALPLLGAGLAALALFRRRKVA